MDAEEAARQINKEFKKSRKQFERYEKALVFYKGNPKEICETLGLFELEDDELADYIDSELEEKLLGS
jgi:hypothetical protein